MPESLLSIEVAYALPEDQAIFSLRVPPGTTAADAVAQVAERLPAGTVTDDLGIFGRRIKVDQPLRDGDRVELYRPLTADPKVVRRELARMGKSMGSAPKRGAQTDGGAT